MRGSILGRWDHEPSQRQRLDRQPPRRSCCPHFKDFWTRSILHGAPQIRQLVPLIGQRKTKQRGRGHSRHGSAGEGCPDENRCEAFCRVCCAQPSIGTNPDRGRESLELLRHIWGRTCTHASNFEPLLEAGQKKVGNYNKIQGLRTLIVLTQEDMVCTQDTEEEVKELQW